MIPSLRYAIGQRPALLPGWATGEQRLICCILIFNPFFAGDPIILFGKFLVTVELKSFGKAIVGVPGIGKIGNIHLENLDCLLCFICSEQPVSKSIYLRLVESRRLRSGFLVFVDRC